eukprot:351639-Chlamydomonas_euryale.AAC.10
MDIYYTTKIGKQAGRAASWSKVRTHGAPAANALRTLSARPSSSSWLPARQTFSLTADRHTQGASARPAARTARRRVEATRGATSRDARRAEAFQRDLRRRGRRGGRGRERAQGRHVKAKGWAGLGRLKGASVPYTQRASNQGDRL